MLPIAWLPFIAVGASAIFLTLTKIFFRRYGKLTNREFVWLQFAGILFVLLLTLPFFGQLPDLELAKAYLPLLLAMVVLATVSNLFFFWGIEHEKISEVEPFLLFQPLMAILIAGMFYADERIWPIYIAIVIASAVLLWSHFKKHRFAFTQALWAIMIVILIYGFEMAAAKTLLTVYSPLALYFVRSLSIFIALLLFYRPNFRLIKPHHLAPFGIIGALAVVSVVAAYTAFQSQGLAATIFIFTLSPVLIYLMSIIFLHDKWRIKNIVASIVIIGLVIWISLIK